MIVLGNDHRPQHDHDGNDLTIGCPACIERVAKARRLAAIIDAPVRRCTWRFRANDKTHSFTLDVKVPTGWEGWQVDDEYAGDTGAGIGIALIEAGDTECEGMWEACNTIRCTVGPIVEQPPATIPGQETLL